jgi:hypothetical protein
VNAFPELRAGRFVVIADFEDPRHMELFQAVNVSGKASAKRDARTGRGETGGGCMVATLASTDDAIVISNARAEQWYLKRDWRAYDVLLLSVHISERDLDLQMTIAGGRADRRLAAETSLRVHRGWNLLRLDLAEIGERVPLDDVQRIRLSATVGAKPVQIRIDDVLLTASREDLLGDSAGRQKGLYVQRVGRRWKIGAAGMGADFELTFANGQIVEWYNVSADPHRLHNLVRGTTLGPSIVELEPGGLLGPGLEALGEAVLVRSALVEVSPVRVVVTSEWRYVSDPEQPIADPDARPFQRWVYTIYPTGQLYVGVEATTATDTWSAPRLGLAVSVAKDAHETPTVTTVATSQRGPAGERAVAHATLRNGVPDAFIMFVPDRAESTVAVVTAARPAGRTADSDLRTIFTASARPGKRGVGAWACHLLLRAAGDITESEARARALAYAYPETPELLLGSPGVGGAGRANATGFDPRSGCYDIAPEDGGVRFLVDGTKRPWYSPAFRVLNTDTREAWVYVDHLIHGRVARDREGHILFQIPGVIGRASLVEVVFSSSRGTQGG